MTSPFELSYDHVTFKLVLAVFLRSFWSSCKNSYQTKSKVRNVFENLNKCLVVQHWFVCMLNLWKFTLLIKCQVLKHSLKCFPLTQNAYLSRPFCIKKVSVGVDLLAVAPNSLQFTTTDIQPMITVLYRLRQNPLIFQVLSTNSYIHVQCCVVGAPVILYASYSW